MMTAPTNNNVPSNSVQDRLYNAEKFDEFMNSDNPNYTDRKGNSRWTLNGIRIAISNWMTSLGTSVGSAYIGKGNDTVSNLLEASITEYLTAEDQNTLRSSLGAEVNVDYALKAAIDAGILRLRFPRMIGIYVLGADPVTLPIGFSMVGDRTRLYTAPSDSTFLNKGTVLRLSSGASSLFLLTQKHQFSGINFDGRDKTVNLMKGADQTQFCRFYNCGIHRWLNGLGGSSSGGYTATLSVSFCDISGNYRGVRNLIDSKISDSTINANDTNGVELNVGANNNVFINVRNEWNNGVNYYGYGGKRNIVVGELCDRAGLNGIVAAGGAQWSLEGVNVQRSGRLATQGSVDDAHFYVTGEGSSIIMSGVYTTQGSDDTGGGRVSPSYTLAGGGNSSDTKTFSAVNSVLSGFGVSAIRPGSSTFSNMSVVGCNGFYDRISGNTINFYEGNFSLGKRASSLSLSGTGSTAQITFPTTDSFPQYRVGFTRQLHITARNNINTGSVAYYNVPLFFYREQSTAVVRANTSKEETMVTLSGGTWGLTAASPTGVAIDLAVSSDGLTLTVTLTAIDNSSRIIDVELRA